MGLTMFAAFLSSRFGPLLRHGFLWGFFSPGSLPSILGGSSFSP